MFNNFHLFSLMIRDEYQNYNIKVSKLKPLNKLLTRKSGFLVIDNLAEFFCSLNGILTRESSRYQDQIPSTSDNKNQLPRSIFFGTILYNHFFLQLFAEICFSIYSLEFEKIMHHSE